MSVALKLKKPPAPLERYEQEAYFGWIRTVRYLGESILEDAYAVPNGSFLHGTIEQRAIQGNALRRQGVKAGHPDINLDIAREPYHGLRIEMKRIGGDGPNDTQLAAHTRLRRRGYRVDVCYGFEQAQRVTLEYLGLIQEDAS
jgi:hypothetical protein